MSAYYNEFDPFAAAWLRELIKDGLIAEGEVDERSIVDVAPEDLRGFTQCHFFAGIGGWSLAARLAGWGDDIPMWTGSPPCQPFSAAGNRKGKDDLRHLWPVFFNLIRECQPPVVFGEQVASAIRMGWFDDLQADMEAEEYATGMVVLPACSVGAPHKRDRLFYVAQRVANADDSGQQGQGEVRRSSDPAQDGDREINRVVDASWIGSSVSSCREQSEKHCAVGNTEHNGSHGAEIGRGSVEAGNNNSQWSNIPCQSEGTGRSKESGNICHWADSRFIYCRDDKYRPIPTEPALFPLANGLPNRVGLLRGAGNAIVPQVGAEVIMAFMEEIK